MLFIILHSNSQSEKGASAIKRIKIKRIVYDINAWCKIRKTRGVKNDKRSSESI